MNELLQQALDIAGWGDIEDDDATIEHYLREHLEALGQYIKPGAKSGYCAYWTATEKLVADVFDKTWIECACRAVLALDRSMK